jgi:hypothetical protein
MAFAPRRVMTDDLRWKRRYGNLQTRFRGLRARNHEPSLVKQMALRGANGNWIGEPTCVMFRHRLALDVGGFRNDIHQLVDLDLWDWRVPDTESTRIWSRVVVFWIQLISQATGVWVCLQAAAYSAGVR